MNTVKRRFVVSLITIIALVITMIPTIGLQSAEAASAGSTVVRHITATPQFPVKRITYVYNGDNTFNMKLTLDFTVYQGTKMDLEQLNDSEIYIKSKDRTLASINVEVDTSNDEMTIDLAKCAEPAKEGESLYIKIELFHSAQDEEYAGYSDFVGQSVTAPTVADVTDPDVAKDIFDSVKGYTLKECLSDTNEEYIDVFAEFKAQVKSGAGNYLYAFKGNEIYGKSSTTNADTVSALVYRTLSSNKIDITGKSTWILIAAPDIVTAKEKIKSVTSNGNGQNITIPSYEKIKNKMPTNYRVTQTSSRYDQMKVTGMLEERGVGTIQDIREASAEQR